jgi:hypothetical protein
MADHLHGFSHESAILRNRRLEVQRAVRCGLSSDETGPSHSHNHDRQGRRSNTPLLRQYLSSP